MVRIAFTRFENELKEFWRMVNCDVNLIEALWPLLKEKEVLRKKNEAVFDKRR